MPFNPLPLEQSPFASLPRYIHLVFFVLFLASSALAAVRFCQANPIFGQARWPEGVLMVLAVATTLAALAKQLPGQNVIVAAVIIVVIAGGVQCLGALTGVPFGPCAFTESFGQMLFYPLPWAAPLVWLVFILNARGVARLILHPWRRTAAAYGLWLIGLSVVLVVLLDIGLEPFATQIKHYWLWNQTKPTLAWYGTPWVNFVGWAVTALVILAFATPWLLNKTPARQRLRYDPLMMWLLLNGLFASAAFSRQFWLAGGLISVASLIVSALAVRGVRWQTNSTSQSPPPA
jgi:uncharacterized membrane protein